LRQAELAAVASNAVRFFSGFRVVGMLELYCCFLTVIYTQAREVWELKSRCLQPTLNIMQRQMQHVSLTDTPRRVEALVASATRIANDLKDAPLTV
jgi:hypothetical protein